MATLNPLKRPSRSRDSPIMVIRCARIAPRTAVSAAGVAGRPSSSAVIARCPIPVTTHAHAPT
ncbi:hypothetical protein WMF37_32650 [Sorangium sp. So ce291]